MFLQEQHAMGRYLLFDFNDPAEGTAALGTDWSDEALCMILLSPEGDILYRAQGAINPLEVRRSILKYVPDDRYIGRHAYWNSLF